MKKKFICGLMALLLMGAFSFEAMAQQSVEETIRLALSVKAFNNKKNSKELAKSYAKAQKEINSMLAATSKKITAYEAVAENADTWSAMQNELLELKADNKIAFEIVEQNYDSILTDARKKLCDYYYNTAAAQLNKAKKYEQQVATFPLFDKSVVYGNDYADSIVIIKNGVQIKEAYTLAESKKEEDRIAAIALFGEIAERNANDSAVIATITPEWNHVRDGFYNKAEVLFVKRDYQSQYDAMKNYEVVGDYKEAVAKAAIARHRGLLTVAVVDESNNTAIELDKKTLKELQHRFPEYFVFTGLEGLNRSQLIEKGCAIIFSFNSKKFGDYNYSVKKDHKEQDRVKYTEMKTDKNGMTIEDEVSQKAYEKGTKGDKYENFHAYHGKMMTDWADATIELNYQFNVIDLRGGTEQTAGTVEEAGHFVITEQDNYVERYMGDPQCQPSELKNVQNNMNENAMVNKAKDEKIFGWDINNFLEEKAKEIYKEVEKMLPYVHFEN